MEYTEFLKELHIKRAGVRLYLEIGCRQGRSLNLSRAKKNIGVDPDFNITWPLRRPTVLYKQTSDDFFAGPAQRVLTQPVDIAFIDGMHLSEFALRDFINVEKYCNGDSVVVLDDVLPYQIEIGSRTRHTREWTGDIYKLISVLKTHRPDLTITVADVAVKGLMVIQGLDPTNTVLADNYDAIAAELVRDDTPTTTVEEIRAIAEPISPEQALAVV